MPLSRFDLNKMNPLYKTRGQSGRVLRRDWVIYAVVVHNATGEHYVVNRKYAILPVTLPDDLVSIMKELAVNSAPVAHGHPSPPAPPDHHRDQWATYWLFDDGCHPAWESERRVRPHRPTLLLGPSGEPNESAPAADPFADVDACLELLHEAMTELKRTLAAGDLGPSNGRAQRGRPDGR